MVPGESDRAQEGNSRYTGDIKDLAKPTLILSVEVPALGLMAQCSFAVRSSRLQALYEGVSGMFTEFCRVYEDDFIGTERDAFCHKLEALRKSCKAELDVWQGSLKSAVDCRLKADRISGQLNKMRDAYFKELFHLREQVYQKNKAEQEGTVFQPNYALLFDPSDFAAEDEVTKIVADKVNCVKQEFETKLSEMEAKYQDRVRQLRDQLKAKQMLLCRKQRLLDKAKAGTVIEPQEDLATEEEQILSKLRRQSLRAAEKEDQKVPSPEEAAQQEAVQRFHQHLERLFGSLKEASAFIGNKVDVTRGLNFDELRGLLNDLGYVCDLKKTFQHFSFGKLDVTMRDVLDGTASRLVSLSEEDLDSVKRKGQLGVITEDEDARPDPGSETPQGGDDSDSGLSQISRASSRASSQASSCISRRSSKARRSTNIGVASKVMQAAAKFSKQGSAGMKKKACGIMTEVSVDCGAEVAFSKHAGIVCCFAANRHGRTRDVGTDPMPSKLYCPKIPRRSVGTQAMVHGDLIDKAQELFDRRASRTWDRLMRDEPDEYSSESWSDESEDEEDPQAPRNMADAGVGSDSERPSDAWGSSLPTLLRGEAVGNLNFQRPLKRTLSLSQVLCSQLGAQEGCEEPASHGPARRATFSDFGAFQCEYRGARILPLLPYMPGMTLAGKKGTCSTEDGSSDSDSGFGSDSDSGEVSKRLEESKNTLRGFQAVRTAASLRSQSIESFGEGLSEALRVHAGRATRNPPVHSNSIWFQTAISSSAACTAITDLQPRGGQPLRPMPEALVPGPGTTQGTGGCAPASSSSCQLAPLAGQSDDGLAAGSSPSFSAPQGQHDWQSSAAPTPLRSSVMDDRVSVGMDTTCAAWQAGSRTSASLRDAGSRKGRGPFAELSSQVPRRRLGSSSQGERIGLGSFRKLMSVRQPRDAEVQCDFHAHVVLSPLETFLPSDVEPRSVQLHALIRLFEEVEEKVPKMAEHARMLYDAEETSEDERKCLDRIRKLVVSDSGVTAAQAIAKNVFEKPSTSFALGSLLAKHGVAIGSDAPPDVVRGAIEYEAKELPRSARSTFSGSARPSLKVQEERGTFTGRPSFKASEERRSGGLRRASVRTNSVASSGKKGPVVDEDMEPVDTILSPLSKRPLISRRHSTGKGGPSKDSLGAAAEGEPKRLSVPCESLSPIGAAEDRGSTPARICSTPVSPREDPPAKKELHLEPGWSGLLPEVSYSQINVPFEKESEKGDEGRVSFAIKSYTACAEQQKIAAQTSQSFDFGASLPLARRRGAQCGEIDTGKNPNGVKFAAASSGEVCSGRRRASAPLQQPVELSPKTPKTPTTVTVRHSLVEGMVARREHSDGESTPSAPAALQRMGKPGAPKAKRVNRGLTMPLTMEPSCVPEQEDKAKAGKRSTFDFATGMEARRATTAEQPPEPVELEPVKRSTFPPRIGDHSPDESPLLSASVDQQPEDLRSSFSTHDPILIGRRGQVVSFDPEAVSPSKFERMDRLHSAASNDTGQDISPSPAAASAALLAPPSPSCSSAPSPCMTPITPPPRGGPLESPASMTPSHLPIPSPCLGQASAKARCGPKVSPPLPTARGAPKQQARARLTSTCEGLSSRPPEGFEQREEHQRPSPLSTSAGGMASGSRSDNRSEARRSSLRGAFLETLAAEAALGERPSRATQEASTQPGSMPPADPHSPQTAHGAGLLPEVGPRQAGRLVTPRGTLGRPR